jgi:hypothetical protein
MVDRGAARAPSFGVSSYYFGTNIPGKPRKYLLNSAGRPKLFAVIADVRADGYQAFKLGATSHGRDGGEWAADRTGQTQRRRGQ